MSPDVEHISLENTNHCNSACFFCPRERLTRRRGVMTMECFGLAKERLSATWPDFEGYPHLHGCGEPLIDRLLPNKVRMARSTRPRCRPFIGTTLSVPVGRAYLEAPVTGGLVEIRASLYAFNEQSYPVLFGVGIR